jgi:hypothetical protein
LDAGRDDRVGAERLNLHLVERLLTLWLHHDRSGDEGRIREVAHDPVEELHQGVDHVAEPADRMVGSLAHAVGEQDERLIHRLVSAAVSEKETSVAVFLCDDERHRPVELADPCVDERDVGVFLPGEQVVVLHLLLEPLPLAYVLTCIAAVGRPADSGDGGVVVPAQGLRLGLVLDHRVKVGDRHVLS